MKIKKVLSALFTLLFITAMTTMTPEGPKDSPSRNSIDSITTPRPEYTPDGDRASNYPPYHRPDK